MKSLIPLLLLLAGCTSYEQSELKSSTEVSTSVSTTTTVSTSTSTSISILPVCPAKTPTGCPEKGAYQAADISYAVNAKLLNQLKCSGIDTIIRYYDWPGQESLKGKIPKDDEIALIKKYGFKILFVFQHYNQNFSTFTDSSRPAKDVAAILQLTKKFGQPKGSGIYVGVDGDFGSSSQLASVRTYFGSVAPKLREAGFKVGMYGGGANCTSLQKAGLIDLPRWIAASS